MNGPGNTLPGEVWIGTEPAVAQWGERLAQCKGKQTVPLYYSPRNRTFYEFKGHHVIEGDTTEPTELAARKSPVPLSRVTGCGTTATICGARSNSKPTVRSFPPWKTLPRVFFRGDVPEPTIWSW